MQYHRVIFFLLLFSLFNSLNAQEEIHESLVEYETADLDRKIDLFFFFYDYVIENEEDSILYYIEDLQTEGRKHKREDAIAMANYGILPYLQDNSLYEEAIEKVSKAIAYYKKVENDTMLSDAYNSMGNTFFLQGKIDKAEYLYHESAKFAKRSGIEKFFMMAVSNLARIDIQREKYDEAELKIERYIQFLKESNGSMKKLAAAYGLLGQLYLNQNDLENAIVSFTKSMEYGLTVGSLKTVANGYTNLAISEFFLENYDQSEQYFQLALAYRIKDNDQFYIAEGYYNLGDFYMGIQMLDSALVKYEKSIEVGQSIGNYIIQKDALLQVSGVYEAMDKKDLQIQALKEIIELQEKINKEQQEKGLEALRTSHNQSIADYLNIGEMREDELRSQLNQYNSVFNNWIVVVVLSIIGLVMLFLFIKRAKKA